MTQARDRAPVGIAARRNFSWVLAGNVALAASHWLTLVIIARLAGPDALGRYALALSIATPITVLFQAQLRVVYVSDVSWRFELNDYLTLRGLTSLAAIVVITLVAFGYAGLSAGALVVVIVGVAKAVEGASDLFYAVFQRTERMTHIGLSQTIRGVSRVAAVAVGFKLANSLLAAVALMLALWSALAVFDFVRARHVTLLSEAGGFRPRWHPIRLGRLARQAFPLGLVAIMGTLYLAIPGYVLVVTHDEASLGIFVTLASLPFVLRTIVEAIGHTALPRLVQCHVANERQFWRLTRRLMLLVAGLAALQLLAAAVVGRHVLELLYGGLYAEESRLLTWVMLAALAEFLAAISGFVLASRQQFAWTAWSLLAGLVVEGAAALAFVPRHGVEGASWSLVLGAAIWLGMCLAGLTFEPEQRRRRAATGTPYAAANPALGLPAPDRAVP